MQEQRHMTLQCPHCRSVTAHERQDILGDWVICSSCDRHFAWREAEQRRTTGRFRRRARASNEREQ